MKSNMWWIAAILIAFSAQASAKNTPCSGKKGGISHCQGALFICNDGSASKSKMTCAADDATTKKPNKGKQKP